MAELTPAVICVVVVPTSTFQTLVVSLVLSRLDYGNAVLLGLPAYLLNRLQSVLNAAARLIFGLRYTKSPEIGRVAAGRTSGIKITWVARLSLLPLSSVARCRRQAIVVTVRL